MEEMFDIVEQGQNFTLYKTDNNFWAVKTGPHKLEGSYTSKPSALSGIRKYLARKREKLENAKISRNKR